MFSGGRRTRDGLSSGWLLPGSALVSIMAAMAFLASLAMAGFFGACVLSDRWSSGTQGIVTVQVPSPASQAEKQQDDVALSRIDAVMQLLQKIGNVASVRLLGSAELEHLLEPWLGVSGMAALPLPAVIEVHMKPGSDMAQEVPAILDRIAPGTMIEGNDKWRQILAHLAMSLTWIAELSMGAVCLVLVMVVSMVTRLGLGARRETVLILHGMGVEDGYIASRFGRYMAKLSVAGGCIGTLMALPVLSVLGQVSDSFSASGTSETLAVFAHLPPVVLHGIEAVGLAPSIVCGLLIIPIMVMLIGWMTAQLSVRIWLRRLP